MLAWCLPRDQFPRQSWKAPASRHRWMSSSHPELRLFVRMLVAGGLGLTGRSWPAQSAPFSTKCAGPFSLVYSMSNLVCALQSMRALRAAIRVTRPVRPYTAHLVHMHRGFVQSDRGCSNSQNGSRMEGENIMSRPTPKEFPIELTMSADVDVHSSDLVYSFD